MISSELESGVVTSETKVSTGATDSSLATGLAVFEPHPNRRIRAEISIIVCFMGAKVIHSDDNNEKNWGKIKTAPPFYSDAVLSEH